jgi:hypothetical protein
VGISISQRYGSEDPHLHPDPYQNVTDPEEWYSGIILFCYTIKKTTSCSFCLLGTAFLVSTHSMVSVRKDESSFFVSRFSFVSFLVRKKISKFQNKINDN